MADSTGSATANDASAAVTRRGVVPALLLLSLVGATSVTGLWVSNSGPFAVVTQSDSVPDAEHVTADSLVAPPATVGLDAPSDASAKPELSPADAEQARLIVGTWEQERFGKRLMTVKADGTASMTIRPSGIWATMFGEQIDLEMYWSVCDGHIDYGVSGGSSAEQVKMARDMWGDHWVEKIEKLSEDELVLLDQSTSNPSGWKRVTKKAASAPAGVADKD